MNTHRIVRAITLAAALISGLSSAAENDRHFLRSIGAFSLSNAKVHTDVTVSTSTNQYPTVSIVWRSGDVTTSNTKPMTKTGWFVFAEQPTRVWVFTGEILSLVEQTDETVSDSSSVEAFKTCPKQVRDALPEEIRRRYFK